MALTRDFKQTIQERAEKDPDFAAHLMNEAATSFLDGNAHSARILLRELVNATIGFEPLAETLDKPSKSIHRMLSPRGNPTMDSLTSIFAALQRNLDLRIEVKLSGKQLKRSA